ncbi:hypothetical protein ACFLW6_04845, partial [Chloroflexota bacterium]
SNNFGDKALGLALGGGEDYELLFIARDEVVDKVRKAAPCPVTVIGEMEGGKAGQVNLIDIKEKPFHLPGVGWEHFRAE